MKWYLKLILALTLLALLAGTAGMVYVVRAKFAANDYNTQVTLAINAAMMVNAQETHTDAENAIIAETENGRFVIVPENYRTLTFYLKVQAVMPVYAHVGEDAPLKISICGESIIYAEPADNGDGAYLRFVSGDDSFTMHVRDVELWDELIRTCEYGTTRGMNIPLP